MSSQINKKENITDSNRNWISPQYNRSSFHCPHCEAFAHQIWEGVFNNRYIHIDGISSNRYTHIDGIRTSFCNHCEKYSVWVNEQMVYPLSSTAPMPIDEMPESVKEIYNEARSILNESPKAACALLRLSIEKLLKELKVNGRNLNDKIGKLVEEGLPGEVQEALDVVRVTGNSAIHPGQIDINDNTEIVNSLFELVNFICEKTIKKKQKIKNLYEGLPNSQREAIKKRDSLNKNE